jgi:hypothetical protein
VISGSSLLEDEAAARRCLRFLASIAGGGGGCWLVGCEKLVNIDVEKRGGLGDSPEFTWVA